MQVGNETHKNRWVCVRKHKLTGKPCLKGQNPPAALKPLTLEGGQHGLGTSSEAEIFLDRGKGGRGGKTELLRFWNRLFTAVSTSATGNAFSLIPLSVTV